MRSTDKYPTLAEAANATQKLGFKSQKEYKKNYKQDPRLPSNPQQYYKDEWESWLPYLGQDKPDLYPTFREASDACQFLGISKKTEYESRHYEDPRLPSNPNTIYRKDWKGWAHFLGKKAPAPTGRYKTYEEAKEAARSLGFETRNQYKVSRTLDPRLPLSPERVYAGSWENWGTFLGAGKAFYPTYDEAKNSARSFKFKSQVEYKRRSNEDPKLHPDPKAFYGRDWESWKEFLGDSFERLKDFYPNLEAASAATKTLGISTQPEYHRRYRDDPRLPAHPAAVYKHEWQNWPAFLGTDLSGETLGGAFWEFKESMPVWKEAAEEYVLDSHGQDHKIVNIRAFLNEVVLPSGCTDWPAQLLHKQTTFPKTEFKNFIYSATESARERRYVACLYFLDWILEKYCSEETDEGELIQLPDYRNPIAAIFKYMADDFKTVSHSESVKPVLPVSVIARARNYLVPEEYQTFSQLEELHDLFDDCWFEVAPSLIDRDDPDCVWRERIKNGRYEGKGNRTAYEIWCPVKLIALYTLLMVPLRGQQILWLDSGEADHEIPILNGCEIIWVKNDTKLGKYKREQGFIRRFVDGGLGMFVTTNKTGGKPYTAPYMPGNLAYWIIKLRDWQSKYNPLKKPTPWTEIELRSKTNENVLAQRGSQTFLFRNPVLKYKTKSPESPLKTDVAFKKTLPALLAAIQQPGENLAELHPDPSRKQYISPFTTHSLRTSLITALVVDGGCPPHVVMKLVGHATIVMTLYYTKIGHGKMRQELEEAEKRALESNIDRIKDFVFDKKIEDAKSQLIATDGGSLSRLDASWPSAAYQFLDFGFCPMSGQGCEQGGPVVVDRKVETVYAPVEAGYLGKRNCPRCRFFVTGPAWLGGLEALGNQILLEVNVVRKEWQELVEAQQNLEDEKYDAERAGRLFENMKLLNQTTATAEEKAHKLDVLLTDFQHVYKLGQQCISLLNEGDKDDEPEGKQQLIVSESRSLST